MLADADDFDFGSSSSSSDSENSGEGFFDSDDDAAVPEAQDDVFDSWEDAPDFEEIERRKKEEEEARKKAEEEAAEAERQRKEAKKLMREKAKELKEKLNQESSDDDEGGLFDVDLARADAEKKDFEAAIDALGLDDDEEVTVDDYMNFVPVTIGDFDGLRQKLLSVFKEKINMKSKEAPQLVGTIIRGIIDDYKSQQMKALNNYIIKLNNEKLHEQRKKFGKKDKKTAAAGKTYANVKDDGFDDFM